MDSFTEGIRLRMQEFAGTGLITTKKMYQKKTYSLTKGYHTKRKTL